jgi:hypothetical protein
VVYTTPTVFSTCTALLSIFWGLAFFTFVVFTTPFTVCPFHSLYEVLAFFPCMVFTTPEELCPLAMLASSHSTSTRAAIHLFSLIGHFIYIVSQVQAFFPCVIFTTPEVVRHTLQATLQL